MGKQTHRTPANLVDFLFDLQGLQVIKLRLTTKLTQWRASQILNTRQRQNYVLMHISFITPKGQLLYLEGRLATKTLQPSIAKKASVGLPDRDSFPQRARVQRKYWHTKIHAHQQPMHLWLVALKLCEVPVLHTPPGLFASSLITSRFLQCTGKHFAHIRCEVC